MECKVGGCSKDAVYKKDQVCQMHYFRMMRNGSYELAARKTKYRYTTANGYEKLHHPDHALADSSGYVYEHRHVYFESGKPHDSCAICGASVDWSSLHIDHIDNDKSNNRIDNLRATCRGCNTFRGHDTESLGKFILTANGVTMDAEMWSRQDGVHVTGATIRRRKRCGMSDFDAIFSSKKTHKSNSKQRSKRHDEERMSKATSPAV